MKVLLQAFQSTIKFVRGHKSRIYWKSINLPEIVIPQLKM